MPEVIIYAKSTRLMYRIFGDLRSEDKIINFSEVCDKSKILYETPNGY